MDIKEFAQEFIENVKMSAEMTGSDYDQELATSILEYMEDNGEVNAPEICSFQKTRTRITAYDYNDEAESLDLFYLVKAHLKNPPFLLPFSFPLSSSFSSI